MNLSHVTLSGKHIRLEPLQAHHAHDLACAGLFPDLWQWQPAPVVTEVDMQRYVQVALEDEQRKSALPFVIIEAQHNQIIGSTRFMDIALQHFRLEIGATWLTPRFQRGPANTEAKLLLLGHAFENSAIKRVVFKTEALNVASRTALIRIGAVEEGTFRQHLYTATGRVRDMVYFSILASEWPQVKSRLTSRLLESSK